MINRSSILVLGLSAVSVLGTASTPDRSTCNSWLAACHYTAANREADYNINRVVIHKTEGATAGGAASWFTNCSSGGSAHFVYEKSNGYCYQCVLEHNIAWHAGYSSTNNNSVGIEHSGWTANDDSSTAMYDQSAGETASCVTYYAVPNNRSYIIGHSEVPGCSGYGGGVNCHTDPGPYWNWGYYMTKTGGGGGGGTLPTYTLDAPTDSGSWALSSSATDKFGADYKYHSTAAASDPASWAAAVTAGTYNVYAWWSVGTNRSTTAPYILPNNVTVQKNQQVSGGSWQLLGSVALSGTATTKLSIWTTTGYIVIADAVRYAP